MAISIDWGTRVISVPRADMQLVQSVPVEIRALELDSFRRELKSLEDDPDGMPFPDTHRHNTIVELGGVTYARTIEIINGYTVTFEDGQYAVNLIGANSNVGDVVNVNQVSVRSANSAGLTYSKEIENQSFLDGRVWIHTTKGRSGTAFPRGTPADMVNNPADADAIADNRGIGRRFYLHGFVQPVVDLADENWVGDSPVTAGMTLIGLDNTDCAFNRMYVTGVMNGPCTSDYGFFDDITNFHANSYQVGFAGTIIVDGVMASDIILRDCYSAVAGTGTPIFDFSNAFDIDWQFRGWTGGLEIRNLDDPLANFSIDLRGGHLKLAATVTEGTFVVRGDGHITNNAGPNVVIVQKGLNPNKDTLTTQKYIALK
jgi:hypothetical protein